MTAPHRCYGVVYAISSFRAVVDTAGQDMLHDGTDVGIYIFLYTLYTIKKKNMYILVPAFMIQEPHKKNHVAMAGRPAGP
jgi:hypothetical protein